MIGTITIGHKVGFKPSAPLPVIPMTFLGDALYVAGGTAGIEAALRAKVGMAVEILGIVDNTASATHVPVWNAATGKLMLIVRTTGVEVVNGDYSAETFSVLAICR